MEYVRQFGYHGAIAVIPNPANLPDYLKEVATLKQTFLENNKMIKFGFLGRLHPIKKNRKSSLWNVTAFFPQ